MYNDYFLIEFLRKFWKNTNIFINTAIDGGIFISHLYDLDYVTFL